MCTCVVVPKIESTINSLEIHIVVYYSLSKNLYISNVVRCVCSQNMSRYDFSFLQPIELYAIHLESIHDQTTNKSNANGRQIKVERWYTIQANNTKNVSLMCMAYGKKLIRFKRINNFNSKKDASDRTRDRMIPC